MNLSKIAVNSIIVLGLVPFQNLVSHAAAAEGVLEAPGTGSRSTRSIEISPDALTRAHFDRALLEHLRAVHPLLETPDRAVDKVLERVESADSKFIVALAGQTLAYGLMFKPGRNLPRSFHPSWDFALNSVPEAQARFLAVRSRDDSGEALEAFKRLVRTTSKITGMHISRLRLILDALYLGESDAAHSGIPTSAWSGKQRSGTLM